MHQVCLFLRQKRFIVQSQDSNHTTTGLFKQALLYLHHDTAYVVCYLNLDTIRHNLHTLVN